MATIRKTEDAVMARNVVREAAAIERERRDVVRRGDGKINAATIERQDKTRETRRRDGILFPGILHFDGKFLEIVSFTIFVVLGRL